MNNDDDHSICTDSTIEENPDSDTEWPVKEVLAEAFHDGERKYLIEWDGYPLAAASWEPQSNLKKDLLDIWEQTKLDQQKGLAPKFKIQKWRHAFSDQYRAKWARHGERNFKRARRGLPETTWDMDLKEFLEKLKDLPRDEDDEADDEDDSMPPPKTPNDTSSEYLPSRSASSSSTLVTSRNTGSSLGSRESFSLFPERNPLRRNTFGSTSSGESPQDYSLSTKSPLGQGSLRKEPLRTAEENGRPRPSGTTSAKPLGSQSGPLSKGTMLSRRSSAAKTVNIFAGGQNRKNKLTLREAAMDPAKEPKMFNPHLTRKLELNRRNLEGMVAPAQRPVLYSLDHSNPDFVLRNSPSPSTPSGDKQPEVAPMEIDSGLVDQTPVLPAADSGEKTAKVVEEQEKTADIPTLNNGAKKASKSVHWDDEPMDIDQEGSLFIGEPPSVRASSERDTVPIESFVGKADKPLQRSSPVPDEMRLDHPQTVQSNCRTIHKKLQLGSDSSQILSLSFEGIPADKDLAWVSSLDKSTQLIFTHLCTAQDFVSQVKNDDSLIHRKLCMGAVSSVAHSTTLQVLVNRLNLGSRAILCHKEGYCVLLFAPRGDEWSSLGPSAGPTAMEASLRYLIFEPPQSFLESLFPLSFSEFLNGPADGSPLYSRVLEELFGPKYEQLLPKVRSGGPAGTRHSFFLSFPPSASDEATMLSKWLRTMNVNCEIRMSQYAGQWSDFLTRKSGVVVIHEDIIWAIRLIPDFCSLVYGRNFSFWVFTKRLHDDPVIDSEERISPIFGDLRLEGIFRMGFAILVTPSFWVSQPEQAHVFLQWFLHSYGPDNPERRGRKGRLVVCARIDDWLYDLWMEKVAQRQRLPPGITEAEMQSMGLHNKALHDRFRIWQILHELVMMDETSYCPIYAPESIDGNDEQSLVNWFGYWSILNMHEFRKFTIMGSSKASRERMSRQMRAPTYTKNTYGDPNELDEELKRSYRAEAPSSAAPLGPRIRNDEATEIMLRLRELEQSIPHREWCPAFLYYFPVAYWHVDMPFKFGDLEQKFKKYGQWLDNLFMEIGFPSMPKGWKPNNTYIGLFYTVEAEWDPQTAVSNPPRRPWIAIFRPQNPHKRPWRSSELFIWDLAFGATLGKKKAIYSDDLPEAQRELIEYVHNHTLRSLPLDHVWIGGFNALGNEEDKPLEVTFQWLDRMLSKIRVWLPAAEMHLPQRGWHRVHPACEKGAEEAAAPASKAVDLIESSSRAPAVADEVPRMIFHPPRGNGQQYFSKCRNRLYDWAAESSPKKKNGQPCQYAFRPTMEWYNEQVEEGRGFAHMKIGPWKELFDAYQVYQVKQPKKSD